jgi:hypothetical protein
MVENRKQTTKYVISVYQSNKTGNKDRNDQESRAGSKNYHIEVDFVKFLKQMDKM